MTNMKAAERAAELANAEPGGIRTWEADDFSVGCVRRAFVQFITDADAAARKARELIVEWVGPKSADGEKAAAFLSPFILPDDVDLLLIEARKLAAEDALETAHTNGIHDDTGQWLSGVDASSAILAGNADKCPAVRGRLRALRRGIEIAEARK